MEKIVLISIGLVLLFNSCKKEKENDFVIFSGKIENPNSDSLTITNRFDYKIHTFHLAGDGTFNDTIHITEGYYHLDDGNGNTQIYLKPNYNLNLSLDSKKSFKSIKYTGKGAYENNYLAKKTLLNYKLYPFNNSGYHSELNEKDYLYLIDSLHRVRMKLFNDHKQNFGKGFSFIDSNSIKYQTLTKIYTFEMMKRIVTGNTDFEVSTNYPNAFDELDLTNGLLSKAQYYIYFLDYYIWKETKKNWNEKDSIDFEVALMKTIGNSIKNNRIKESIAHHMGIQSLDRTNELDEVYNITNSYISNKQYLAEIDEKYTSIKRLPIGSISPNFELYDIKNNLVSLRDLKGKIVYIDIWATWCKPCIREIPHLNKLEEEFRDKEIKFVSICKNDKKERWLKMVNKKELSGIQLFAPDDDISFFTKYMIQAIPRFILIDEEGKIIDINAKRPSDPKLKEQLEKLLYN